MKNDNGKNYIIRNFVKSDASKIGAINKVLELSYLYNGDMARENIFCAVNETNEIYGVGHLEPHVTWSLIDDPATAEDFIFKLNFDICLNPVLGNSRNLKSDILNSLLERAGQIKQAYPGKKIRITKYFEADDIAEMNYYLSQGFVMDNISPVMVFDLSKEIPVFQLPDGVQMMKFVMRTEEDFADFHRAECAACAGIPWRLNYLKWMQGAPGLVNFTAFAGGKVIGNTTVWTIDEGRSATENIFVVPELRNQNIAKYLICSALQHLKDEGKKIATLSTSGTNKRAIRLYKNLGYELYYVMLELGFEFQ